jgi:hypothetical protein
MKRTIFILSIGLLFFACKKKDDPAPGNPSSTTTGNPPAATTASFSALFANQLLYSIYATSATTVNFGINTAYAGSGDFTNFGSPSLPFIDMGTVKLNGVAFKNFSGYYLDSTYNSYPSPTTWIATGNSIPTFTYTNNNPYAGYTDYIAWPDTIVKSAGLSLPLTGITNATEGKIYLSVTGSSVSAGTATVLLGSLTSYSFPPSALTALSTSTSAGIQIDFYNNNVQTINGKKMNFRNTTSYVKIVGVKN